MAEDGIRLSLTTVDYDYINSLLQQFIEHRREKGFGRLSYQELGDMQKLLYEQKSDLVREAIVKKAIDKGWRRLYALKPGEVKAIQDNAQEKIHASFRFYSGDASEPASKETVQREIDKIRQKLKRGKR